MKILFIISHVGTDGPAQALLSIVKGFNKIENNNITVLTLGAPEKDILKSQFLESGADFINISEKSKILLLKSIFKIRNILINQQFLVASSTCIRADFILAISSLGIKNIKIFSTVQNIPSEDLGYLYPGLLGKFLAFAHYIILKSFRKNIICVSKAVSEDLYLKIGTKGLPFLNPISITSEIKYTNQKQPIIVFAASLSRRKNPEEAISFVMNSKLPDNFEFHIYGEGPLEKKLKHRFNREKQIFWKGFTNDLLKVFLSARVYVSSSLSEGLPLTPQIALICGCPCVLSDIPQHKELAKLSKFVFLYKAGDQSDFLRSLNNALQVDTVDANFHGNCIRHMLSPSNSAKMLYKYFQSTL